jgi:Phage P22-like portal protein
MPQTPQSFIEEAETDPEIHAECAERLRIATEVEANNRLLAIEDLEFADGQQWPDDIYNLRKVQRRPTLTINHTATLLRRVINNMREQRPRIKTHPVSDATVGDAKVVNGLIRHVETLSKASVAYDMAGESAVRIGWGYFRIVGEYVDEKSFEQELKIKPVRNALTGYIDPAAQLPDGSDMDWFIFSTKMKKTDYKKKYPKEELNDWTHGGPGDSQHQWESKEEIRLAEYYRVKKTKDTLYQLSNGSTMFKSEYTKNASAFHLAQVMITKERPTERRQIQWFRINGTKIVDRRDLPGHWIPVIRVEGNVLDLNGDVRRKGMIRDLKDPARSVNYWETAKAEKLALSSKAPWVMVEGQADGHPEWDDANQKPYSVLKYKLILGMDGQPIPGVPPPERQRAVEVEAGFAEAAESGAKNLLAVAGMPHEPGQDTPGTVVSGVALRRRQAISDISHFQFYDNQTAAISHAGVILLDLAPFYYPEEGRLQRIIGEDGVPSMMTLNQKQSPDAQGISAVKNDMTVGRYDVVMDTGPGYETKRQEGAEAMIDLLKTPLGEPIAKTGADLIVRNMDFPGASDLADRLMPMSQQGMQKAMENIPDEAKGIVTALQTQLQQVQQELQHAQMELKFKTDIEQGWMKTEIQKAHLAATGKAHDVELRDHTAERDTQVKAHAAIATAEIGAAGKLMDTHAQAGHDATARKDELKAAEAAEKANGAEK